eukprot:TRINITY_DN15672_c0_g1_i1.p1 TRINITY_DN15672_c0_g1~~TRINITY_DN15672_c0_g1_i1.p1  ORF type:complete len:845 (+),score=197.57 TRINITY_DN15672_c0_g1_i1:106-2640(+)
MQAAAWQLERSSGSPPQSPTRGAWDVTMKQATTALFPGDEDQGVTDSHLASQSTTAAWTICGDEGIDAAFHEDLLAGLSKEVDEIVEKDKAMLGVTVSEEPEHPLGAFFAARAEMRRKKKKAPPNAPVPTPEQAHVAQKAQRSWANLLHASDSLNYSNENAVPKDERRFSDYDWDKSSKSPSEMEWDDQEIDAAASFEEAFAHGQTLVSRCNEVLNPALVEQIRSVFMAAALDKGGSLTLKKLYERVDSNQDNSLEYAEVIEAIRKTCKMGPKLVTDSQLTKLCEVLDDKRTGAVPVLTLLGFSITPKAYQKHCDTLRMNFLKRRIAAGTSKRKATINRCKSEPRRHIHLSDIGAELEANRSEFRALKEQNQKVVHRVVCDSVTHRADHVSEETMHFVRRRLRAAAYVAGKGFKTEKLLAGMDGDGSGELNFDELRNLLRYNCKIAFHDLPDHQVATLFAAFDGDASGTIEARELLEFALEGYGSKAAQRAADRATTLERERRRMFDAYKKEVAEQKLKAERDEVYEVERCMHRLYRCLKQQFGSVKTAFEALDLYKEGSLTYNTFKRGLEKHDVPWQEYTGRDDLRYVFRCVNIGQTGAVTLGELLATQDIGEKDADYHIDDLPIDVRRQVFKKQHQLQASDRKTWNLRRPGRTHAKSLPPEPKPPSPSEARYTATEATEAWEKTKGHMAHRDAWRKEQIKAQRDSGKEHCTFSPELSPRSRILMDDPEFSYQLPGFRDNDNRGRHVKVKIGLADDLVECTFSPVTSPRSNRLAKSVYSDGKTANERLFEKTNMPLHDRLGSRHHDYVEHRLHGDAHTPRITASASRLKRPGAIHERLLYGNS